MRTYSVIAVFIVILSVLSCTDVKHHTGNECLTEYIAGVELLHHLSHGMHPDSLSLHLHRLEKTTGITEDDAIAFLHSIKNDPEKGILFSRSLQQLFAEQNSTLKNIKEKL